jgi:DNA-binding transcriptional ArsR family regulator
MKQEGFRFAKEKVLKALADGSYLHETRNAIDVKNLLQMGLVTAEEIASVIRRCTGSHHTSSPHHWSAEITVHVLRRDGWYIKFYFVDPDTVFISVHK